MESKNNVKYGFSFIGLVFFPFVVSWLLSDGNEYNLSRSDLDFINSYKKVGWINILLVLLALLLFLVGIYLKFDLLVFFSEIVVFFVFLNIFVHVFLIFLDRPPLFFIKKTLSFGVEKGERNTAYLFYYLPFLSYFLWLEYIFKGRKIDFVQIIKEASLFYFLLFFAAFLGYYFSGFYYIFYLFLMFLIIRVLGLIFGINLKGVDFSKLYDKFPYEILAYVEGFIYFWVKNLFLVVKGKKTIPYSKYVYQIRSYYNQGYDVNLTLKKIKKYVFLHLSYFVLLLFLGYVFYQAFNSFDNIIIIGFGILGLLYTFFLPVFVSKKLFPLPFVSLFLYLIFKKF